MDLRRHEDVICLSGDSYSFKFVGGGSSSSGTSSGTGSQTGGMTGTGTSGSGSSGSGMADCKCFGQNSMILDISFEFACSPLTCFVPSVLFQYYHWFHNC